MVSTASVTRLDAVMIVRTGPVTEVWLRRNIELRTIVDEVGGEQEVWCADEVHGILPGTPTAEEVEGEFDELWGRFENDGMTDAERIADVRDIAETNSDAIAELAEMAAEGEVTMEDLAQAIIELAEIIGGGE